MIQLPVLMIAITPKTKADSERLAVGLSALMAEDSTVRSTPALREGEVIIGVMGVGPDLRERTQGRATYTMRLERYQPIVGSDGGDDRRSYVGWPVVPRRPLKNSAIALPEP